MLGSIFDSLHVLSLPTKTNFRGVTSREVALFQGPAGWAEFSPFLEYDATECVPWLASAIESASVAAPVPVWPAIKINATLPAVNGREKIAEVLSWFPQCQVIKVKVGGNFEEDLARLSLLKELVPGTRIRIDVNGGWSVSQAAIYILRLYGEVENIEYVEQPCATIEELRLLKRQLPAQILIAGDEVIRKAKDPLSLELAGAVDILILKVAPLGGIQRALEITNHYGLPVVVSSALESAVGISYGLKLASALPTLSYASGLGTGALLSSDVAELPLVAGAIKVRSVLPESSALLGYAVSGARLDWWRERIRQTWLAGAQSWIQREGWSL